MAENIERRKNAFKTKQLNSTERTRKQSEQLRKEKRTANVLSKRLKTDSTEPVNEEFDETQVKEALHNAMNGDPVNRLSALRSLRAILCSSSPRFDLFVESNISVYLSNLLNSPNDDVRLEAAWCLTNMATGGNAETGAVLCAVPNMVEILNSNSLESSVGRDTVEFQEQICWALGNIAGGSEEHRAVLIGNGALLAVLNFLEARFQALPLTGAHRGTPESLKTLASAAQTAAWALSNLARGKVPADLFIQTGKLPFLINLVTLHNHSWVGGYGESENVDPAVVQVTRAIAEEAWWLFAFLTAKEDAAVNVLLGHALVKSLGAAISAVGEETVAAIPLIRCLGNLSSGPAEWLLGLLADPNIVAALLRCSGPAAHRVVIKECLWVVSNVLGGSEASRSFLIQYGSSDASPSPLLENLLRALQRDDFDVQQEATLALEQACLSPACRSMLLTVPQYAAEIVALGRVFERLLRAPGTSDAPISVMRVISALTAAAGELGPGRQLELANVWVEVGITEALDDIQYTAGHAAQGRDGCSVGDVAAALVTQLYALLEDAEREHDDGRGAENGHSHDVSGNGESNGGGIASQFASGFAGESTVAAGHYAFAAPVGSVFAFGPGPDTHTQQLGVTLGDNGSPTPHTSPVAGQSRSGMGRGSHLAKPSWMT